jgi:hypothetical protein
MNACINRQYCSPINMIQRNKTSRQILNYAKNRAKMLEDI